MFEELESVVLAHNIDDYNLKKGDIGVIVFVYNNGAAYEVEFMNSTGGTVGVITLTPADLRPKVYKEVLNASWISGNLNYTAFGTTYHPNERIPAASVYNKTYINTEINEKESGTEIFTHQTI